jgi:hypothetical protein
MLFGNGQPLQQQLQQHYLLYCANENMSQELIQKVKGAISDSGKLVAAAAALQ